jgi:hypothetical protein
MKEILVEHLLGEGSCEVETLDGRKTRISLRRIENKKTCFGSKPQFELGLMYNSSYQHTLRSYPWRTHLDIHVYPPNIEPGGLIPSVAEMADYTIAGNYTSIRVYTY